MGPFRQKLAKLPVLALVCNESAYSPPNFRGTFDPCTNHWYCGTSTLSLLYRRYSLPNPKIENGVIPTSCTRPTWTLYFWCKHLERIARTLPNAKECELSYYHNYLNGFLGTILKYACRTLLVVFSSFNEKLCSLHVVLSVYTMAIFILPASNLIPC